MIHEEHTDAVQRQQTKWFVYALAVGLSLGVMVAALPAATPVDSPFQLLSAPSGPLALAFIPLGLGIAILRYRLWDIDVIINRTLVYGSCPCPCSGKKEETSPDETGE